MNFPETSTIALPHPPVMEGGPAPTRGPLARLAESEIKHLLRGFPESSIAGALALRTGSRIADFEVCLFGILVFYRPPGTDAPDGAPSGAARLHEDLGFDSLSMSEAMFKIEDLFDISVDNAELAEIATIADARRLLVRKFQSQPPTKPNE
jgi:acyl carrier protein